MSVDIFLQGFVDGNATDGDGAASMAIITPFLARPPSDGFARLVTGDGGADIYGLDRNAKGLMVNHATGNQIWHVIVDIARAARYVILPVGCPVCLVDEEFRSQLPDELQCNVVVAQR
jgi:hypothetical protein